MANLDEFNVVDLPEVDETFVEKVNKNSGWRIGTDIVPSVFYQAYFVNGAWNADDESTYRVYVEEPSEVKPEVVKPAAAEEEAAEGEGAEPVEGEGEGEGESEGEGEGEEAADEEEVDRELPRLLANKYGFAKPYEVVRMEITPSESLKAEYPFAIVNIDGKEYDLGILDNPIRFVMSKDHRVVIDWSHGEIYESFRIVVNR